MNKEENNYCYYKEKIKEYIECPEFGNNHYGKWGALNLQQRTAFKNLIFECEDKDKIIKELLIKIDKTREFLENEIDKCNSALTNPEYTICGKHELLKQEKQELIKSLEILKGGGSNE